MLTKDFNIIIVGDSDFKPIYYGTTALSVKADDSSITVICISKALYFQTSSVNIISISRSSYQYGEGSIEQR